MSSPYKDYTLRQARISDPSSTVILEDMISGLNDWRGVEDIVRLSLKTLFDLVKEQTLTIRDLESQLPYRTTRSELNSALAVKANISDITRTFADLKQSIEQKFHIDNIWNSIEEKASKGDLHYIISNKVSIEEHRTSMESKANLREVQAEFGAIRAALEEMQNDFYRKLGAVVSTRDLTRTENALTSKIEALEKEVEEKASKASVSNALQTKPSRKEMEDSLVVKANVHDLQALASNVEVSCESIEILSKELEVKADRQELMKSEERLIGSEKRDIEELSKAFEKKLNYLHTNFKEFEVNITKRLDLDFEKINQELARKAEAEDVKNGFSNIRSDFENSLSELSGQLRYDLTKLESSSSDINGRFEENFRNIHEATEGQGAHFEEEIKGLHMRFNDDLSKLTKDLYKQIESLTMDKLDKAESRYLFEAKANLSDFESAIDRINSDLAISTTETRDKFTDLLFRKEKEIFASIEAKPTPEYIMKLINENNPKILDYTDQVKRELEKLRGEFYRQDSQIKDRIDSISNDLLSKASIKDITSILHSKSDTETVTKALHEINLRLEQSSSDLHLHINEQSLINEAVCAETCVSRFLWKSGSTTSSEIPWEIQSVNTCPENFIWEKNGTTILTIAPGLYEISFGVFGRSRPEICVQVNGETIITDGSPINKLWRHSSGNLTGLTCIDFLALPPRARISMLYSGDSAEGFLGLRKL